MRQQMALITLGVVDLERATRFYRDGFGWTPVFANGDVTFFQMNGFVLALWGRDALAADMQRPPAGTGGFALAHNVGSAAEVDDAIRHLCASGASLLRAADAPPHGGYRGYVADPDGHAWEIAYNPAWTVDEYGHVCFGA